MEEIPKPKKEEDEPEEEKKEGEEEGDAQEKDAKSPFDNEYRSIAVLGIALIAISEDIGNDMALRTMNHLMLIASPTVKRAVPLALALLHLSNPNIVIQDMLSKLAH